jgi:hypothetical protein
VLLAHQKERKTGESHSVNITLVNVNEETLLSEYLRLVDKERHLPDTLHLVSAQKKNVAAAVGGDKR